MCVLLLAVPASIRGRTGGRERREGGEGWRRGRGERVERDGVRERVREGGDGEGESKREAREPISLLFK